MKERTGLKQTLDVVAEYEAAALAKQAAKNKLPQAAQDSGVASAMATDNQVAVKHLPRVWMPILVTRISSVFRRMDINNDGNIDRDELKALFDQDTQQDTTEQMSSLMKDLHVADTNNDGMISATEFSRFFMDHVNKRLIQIKVRPLLPYRPLIPFIMIIIIIIIIIRMILTQAPSLPLFNHILIPF